MIVTPTFSVFKMLSFTLKILLEISSEFNYRNGLNYWKELPFYGNGLSIQLLGTYTVFYIHRVA